MSKKGLRIILSIALIVIILDLILLIKTVIDYRSIGMAEISSTFLISGIVRASIYVIGFYLVYKRKKWARIFLEILLIFRVISGILSLIIQPSIIYMISTIIYITSSIFLFSKSVNCYINNQDN